MYFAHCHLYKYNQGTCADNKGDFIKFNYEDSGNLITDVISV